MTTMIRPNLGQAYIMNNEFEKGVAELIKALALNNTEQGKSFIHANLGYAYSQLKNYGLAMMEYKNALKFSPDNAQIHYALGMLYEGKFQEALARNELEKAIKLAPDDETYKLAHQNLSNMAALSLKVGRTAQPLLTLGLIVTPSYLIEQKEFYPLIIYIYNESPLKKLAKEGDYITNIDISEEGKSLMELLNISPNTKANITINKAKVIINSINRITQKLPDTEKIKLYQNWFKTFDSRIVDIFEMADPDKKESAGTKWGYEFESMIRSWSTYQKDPLFDSAFALLMEFFQAYTTGDNQEVIYEINLAKLNFTIITKSLVDFFHSIGFIITAKYLDNKINSLDKNNLGKPKKLGPIRSNPVTVKKGI
ncbi:MAG: tetratricopeptide repeat protein, partial [Candidatus Sericytochromatia bacterium]|nr:tetratricopeptide repeat protein [Candidatus Sericytochromatia bacterium]